jgi:Fe-S-cluster containining protein
MWCCNRIGIPLSSELTEEQIEHCRMFGVHIEESNGLMWVVIESPCKHITPQGCAIYENRSDICKMFDGRMLDITRKHCKQGE